MSAASVTPVLTVSEQRSAARQLTVAMLALGLLTLGLLWTFLAPAQTGVGQLLLGAAALLVADLGNDGEVGPVGVVVDQLQRDRGRRRRGAVLAGEDEVFADASEVEVGIAEGMQVAGAA